MATDRQVLSGVYAAYKSHVDASSLMTLRDVAISRANRRIGEELYNELTIQLIKFAFRCQLVMAEQARPGSALSRRLGTDPARVLMFYVETFAELIDDADPEVGGDSNVAMWLNAMMYFTDIVQRVRALQNSMGDDPVEKRLAELKEGMSLRWGSLPKAVVA